MLCPFPNSPPQTSGGPRTRYVDLLTISTVGASGGESLDHLRARWPCYLSHAASLKRGFLYNHLHYYIHYFPMPCPPRMGTEIQEVGDIVYLPHSSRYSPAISSEIRGPWDVAVPHVK